MPQESTSATCLSSTFPTSGQGQRAPVSPSLNQALIVEKPLRAFTDPSYYLFYCRPSAEVPLFAPLSSSDNPELLMEDADEVHLGYTLSLEIGTGWTHCRRPVAPEWIGTIE